MQRMHTLGISSYVAMSTHHRHRHHFSLHTPCAHLFFLELLLCEAGIADGEPLGVRARSDLVVVRSEGQVRVRPLRVLLFAVQGVRFKV